MYAIAERASFPVGAIAAIVILVGVLALVLLTLKLVAIFVSIRRRKVLQSKAGGIAMETNKAYEFTSQLKSSIMNTKDRVKVTENVYETLPEAWDGSLKKGDGINTPAKEDVEDHSKAMVTSATQP